MNSGLCLGCSSSYPQASRATFQHKVGAQEMFIDGVLTEGRRSQEGPHREGCVGLHWDLLHRFMGLRAK